MGSRRKHNVLNIETKIEIIEKLDKGESGSSLAQFYNVGKSTIGDIKRKKETILSYASKMDSSDGIKTRKVMKCAANVKLDEALFLWYVQNRNLGNPISGPILCEQALIFNSKMGSTSDFKASSGWLKNFKSRHGIKELNIERKMLYNSTSEEKFKELFLNVIKQEGYTRNDIYNADETSINWKAFPRKSLAPRRESSAPGYKVGKDKITAIVCANASGDHALPLLVIGKTIKPRCFKNVPQLPVKYKAQKSARINSDLFYEWYSGEFIPRVKRERECKGRKGKVLLLLDNAPSHFSVEKLNRVNSDFNVMFFPVSTTAIIQPMDQGVIEKLKRIYRKQILRHLLLADSVKNVASFYNNFNLKDACYMLAESWQSITTQNIKNAWNKLWPIAEVIHEEQKIQEISEITNLLKSIPGFEGNNEVDVNDWLENDANNLGFEILNDDEIVDSVKRTELSFGIENDTNEYEDVENYSGPMPGEAFTALETAMQWYEQQPESNSTELLLLKRIKDLAAKKRNWQAAAIELQILIS
ncbi:jerky protein homolog-like [Rhopalosiphum padi]|uniref:jerky protein homolog-like n=1 Tax=Rhopalosiphum padi TaxID=40932 RepID=UPI00298E2341|nr:jerky protein homolog-like [Rhopalosiphum padi]